MIKQGENKDDQFDIIDIVGQWGKNEHLLGKLRQVFKDGYRPARGNDPYSAELNTHVPAYTMVNCFGHIFNLRNQQFNDYQIPYKLYGWFPGIGLNSNEKATNRMFDFIKEVGLKIEECAPDKPITDFKSWKVALYFEESPWNKDFHYLLEDAPQLWSSKLGFGPYVEHIYDTTPPETYRNLVENQPADYKFYGTYKITNPNADANNRYVKGFNLRSDVTKCTIKRRRHCLIEGERQKDLNNILDLASM